MQRRTTLVVIMLIGMTMTSACATQGDMDSMSARLDGIDRKLTAMDGNLDQAETTSN